MNLENRIQIKENVFAQELDGETVILDVEHGTYFGLDSISTRIWQLLEEHGRLRDAYDRVLEEYEVPAAQLRDDLLTFVNDLLAKNLVTVRKI